MATSNFHNENASKIFAFCLSNDEHDFEFEYGDTVDSVRYELAKKVDSSLDMYLANLIKYDGLRSYNTNSIITIAREVSVGDMVGDIRITALARSGYYEGANLDWELQINVLTNTYDSVGDIDLEGWMEQCYYSSNMNAGLCKIQYPNFIKKMEETKNELIELVESVFKDFSTELGVIARFSNGETIYSKA